MLRKILILLLVMFVLFTPFVAAANNQTDSQSNNVNNADSKNTITEEQAQSIAQNAIKTAWGVQVITTPETPQVNLITFGYTTNNYFLVEWQALTLQGMGNFIVYIDAVDGTVTYLRLEIDNHTYTDTYISPEEARKIADDFLKRMNPDKYKKYELFSDRYKLGGSNSKETKVEYTFYYSRVENNIIINDNDAEIKVNSLTGLVTEYSFHWSDIELSDAKLISRYKAQQIIKNSFDLTLKYYLDKWNNSNDINTYRLMYVPIIEGPVVLDAQTGLFVNNKGQEIDPNRVKDISNQEKDSVFESSKSRVLYTDINIDEAKTILNKYIKMIYGESFYINEVTSLDLSLIYGGDDLNIWSGSFYSTENPNLMLGTIAINATNGRLMFSEIAEESYYKELESITMSWEDGYDKAINAIKQFYPELINSLNTSLIYGNNSSEFNEAAKEYNCETYVFKRYENNVMYDSNFIAIIVDKNTGIIIGIIAVWDNTEMPSKEVSINKAYANIIYFEDYKPQLVYFHNTSVYQNDVIGELPEYFYSMPFMYQEEKAIDATTGFSFSLTGMNKEAVDLEYTANALVTKVKALATLYDFMDVTYNYDSLSPNSNILFTDISESSEYHGLIDKAVELDLVDNNVIRFNPLKNITREEFAEILVRYLGYNTLAEMADIYKPLFKDQYKISKSKVGYVTICYKLGLLSAESNMFQPQKQLTEIEMVIALSKLQNLYYKN